jgi:hypothetical protein
VGLAGSTTALLEYVWPRIRTRLDGLTDDEYRWEPVPGCWSVRPVGDGWQADQRVPPPEPEPVTTIAWRTWHIGGACLDEYTQRYFGTHALDLGPMEWFGTPGEALDAIDAAWRAFSGAFRALDEAAMARPLGPAFGPFSESNLADVLLHVADELIHHGAETALLRDLYLASDGRSLDPQR